jgi:hypothetical protein
MCTCRPETSSPAAALYGLERLLRWKPELGAVVRGLDRVVRLGVDAWRRAHEHASDPRRRRAVDLVERVDDDEGDVGLCGGAQLLVALVVAVDDDPLAGDAGPLSERKLAERRDVGAQTLAREEA